MNDESNASESIDDSKKDNEDPDSSDENKVFWEDSKEDGSLIAIQSIFDSLEELKMPSRHIPIQHRQPALSRICSIIPLVARIKKTLFTAYRLCLKPL